LRHRISPDPAIYPYVQEIIRGADKTLNCETLVAIIIETHLINNPYGFDTEDVHKTLLSYGFSPYKYDPFTRELQKQEIFNTQKYNTLYIRNLNAIQERVQNAPKFSVLGHQI
jgi:hypothetical protein